MECLSSVFFTLSSVLVHQSFSQDRLDASTDPVTLDVSKKTGFTTLLPSLQTESFIVFLVIIVSLAVFCILFTGYIIYAKKVPVKKYVDAFDRSLTEIDNRGGFGGSYSGETSKETYEKFETKLPVNSILQEGSDVSQDRRGTSQINRKSDTVPNLKMMPVNESNITSKGGSLNLTNHESSSESITSRRRSLLEFEPHPAHDVKEVKSSKTDDHHKKKKKKKQSPHHRKKTKK